MATHCEICKRLNRSVKDRFCPTHAKQTLRKLEASGYLEPLVVTTVDGQQKLSKQRFLTLQDGARPQTSD